MAGSGVESHDKARDRKPRTEGGEAARPDAETAARGPSRRPPTPSEIIAAAALPQGGAMPPEALDPVQIIARAAGAATDDPLAIIASALSPGAGTPAPSPQAKPAGPADPYAAFWQVWMAHQSYLRKQTLRLMSGNLADAEDALSNAMLKAMQKFDTYAGLIVNERAWLTRLVHNVCMDLHRSNHRIARSLEETVGEDFDKLAATLAADQRTPEDETIARRAIDDLAAELEEMPQSLKKPLLMRVLEDMSYDEIAQQLALSNCAVRKRIQLARDFLRKRGIR